MRTAILFLLTMSLTSCAFFRGVFNHGTPKPDQGDPPYKPSMTGLSQQQDRWNPGWTHRETWEPGRMGSEHRQRMERHWSFMQSGTPAAYRGQTNPFTPDSGIVREGAELYGLHCAGCHGPQGADDSAAVTGLSPSPALLAYMIQIPMSVDEYMMWTITEGGVQSGTAMPAFKETLTNVQIWKVITFMRAGFPAP